MTTPDINRVLLVHVELGRGVIQPDIEEFQSLVQASDVMPACVMRLRCLRPTAKYFFGVGQANAIAMAVEASGAGLVIVNHDLTPSHQRNLEKLACVRFGDRTELILDIFAKRAHTHEGKLQVELAQLRHLSSRLVRGWTHLERQRGGLGLRGPGETQLETDRRLVGKRIKHLKSKLRKVAGQRNLSRRARKCSDTFSIALVGYTNAGKSTLFNALTKSDVYAEDALFATLDPTVRRLWVPEVGNCVLSDTVGFIHGLPHDLVEAFQATLAEVQQADLIVHVIDASKGDVVGDRIVVEEVLGQLDALNQPRLEVYSKIDNCPQLKPEIQLGDQGMPAKVWLSATKGAGLPQLLKSFASYFNAAQKQHFRQQFPPTRSQKK